MSACVRFRSHFPSIQGAGSAEDELHTEDSSTRMSDEVASEASTRVSDETTSEESTPANSESNESTPPTSSDATTGNPEKATSATTAGPETTSKSYSKLQFVEFERTVGHYLMCSWL